MRALYPSRMDRSYEQRIAALALASAIAFALANSGPLMMISAAGLSGNTTLGGAARALWRHGYELTGAAAFFFSVAAPAALAILAWVGPAEWAAWVRRWAMPDVAMLALIIALIKISGLATVTVGVSAYAAAAFVVVFAALGQSLDAQRRGNGPKPASGPGNSSAAQSTWAFITAAAICYVPANLLPVLVSSSFGGTQRDTIIGGAVYLFHSGTWPLGLIVLIASVMIPVGKLAALVYLLIVHDRGVAQAQRARAQLLAVVDAIGRWSMLDVFVVAFVAALVQLEPVMSARPGPGLPFFAAVVIFTMLAAQSFERRVAGTPKRPE